MAQTEYIVLTLTFNTSQMYLCSAAFIVLYNNSKKLLLCMTCK